ncbi:hypothetical protein [Bacillus thuringiensis]|uniref:hypothetical protein n=1 Tax=Bacillus thuringiensis TaxID=1428 RepID=UPI0037C991A1
MNFLNEFISIHDVQIKKNPMYTQILSVIDIDEFLTQCQRSTSIPYAEATHLACRQATMYILYKIASAIENKESTLDTICICEGYVSQQHHTWILIGDEFYVDLTLAQFFPNHSIPNLSILPVHTSPYKHLKDYSWNHWVQLQPIE